MMSDWDAWRASVSTGDIVWAQSNAELREVNSCSGAWVLQQSTKIEKDVPCLVVEFWGNWIKIMLSDSHLYWAKETDIYWGPCA
jgi:hypothetical protein